MNLLSELNTTYLQGMSLAQKGPLVVYVGAVAVTGVYGLISGINIWSDWRNSRTPYSLKNKTLEPIANAAVDGGKLAFDTVTTTAGCMVVAATFPISVPLLITLNQEDSEDTTPGTEQITVGN